MNYNILFFQLLKSEYAKIKCPICGKSPRVTDVFGTDFKTSYSCPHIKEVEPLIDEAERRCLEAVQKHR